MSHPFTGDSNKAKVYFIAYWVGWAVLLVVLLRYYGYSGSAYVWDAVISCAMLAVVCVIVFNVFIFYQPAKEMLLYWCFMAGIATIIWGFTDQWLLETLVYTVEQQQWLKESMPVRFIAGFLNIIWLMTAAFYREKGNKRLEKRERETKITRTVKDAELYKLRQQLHPHFLFNSLNSINALIRRKPDKAREMVQQLSAFLRGTLKQEENQFIRLKEEKNYLKLYLDIEVVRFGHRLKTAFDLTEEAEACKMPPLMLQPLMENAIKHGLYGLTGTVTIRLKARYLSPYLVVSVSNPYERDQQMEGEGTGFGLKSIRRRLYLLFGRDDLLEIYQGEERFEVIFRIPQKENL